MAVTIDTTDSDGDTIVDSIEAVIGTSSTNNDSDFDRVLDQHEIWNGTDPLEPDSNFDDLPDYFELQASNPDPDGDGIENAWDFDNDNDGVSDAADLSPFSYSTVQDSFHMDITTSGNPTYVTLQLRPRDPEHLKLFYQYWDWPYDTEGSMKDMDYSSEDVRAIPQLNVAVSPIPSQSEVSDYGLLVTPDGLQAPLNPVWDGGDLVAFECRMFFPQSAETNIVLDTDLFWRIMGNTDIESVALRASNDMHASLGEDDAAIAAMASPYDAMLQWIDLGDGIIAIKTFNGAFWSVDSDGTIVASRTLDENAEFQVIEMGDDLALNASNGMLVTLNGSDYLVAQVSEIAEAELFRMIDLGYQSEWTTLVTYPEAFMLTGFTVEESYGSDIELFYSPSKEQIVAADILLSYTFMRNATNSITQQPSILADNGVTVSSSFDSFTHRDKAFKSMGNDMIPSALAMLPAGAVLPIIIANEDHTRLLEMSEVLPGMIAHDPSFVLDVSSFPETTVRTLKTNFYNTSSYSALSLEEVMSEILSWELSETASFNILTMMMKWFNGEQLVSAIDNTPVPHEMPDDEAFNTAQTIVISSLEGLAGISEIIWIWKAFKEMRVLQKGGYGFNSIVRSLKIKNTGLIGSWAKTSRNLGKINKGFYKGFKTAQKALAVFGVILDAALSIYAGILIADSIGGRLGGEIGAIFAISGTLVAIVGAVLLYAIGMIPYVGWLISLGLVIADLFGNYSSKLTEWLSEAIFGEQEDVKKVQIADPGIEILVGPTTDTIDPDGNGLDVGDTIEIALRLRGTVEETVPSSTSIPFSSYIRPWIELFIPQGATWETGEPEWDDLERNWGNYWKSETYDSTAWAQPALPMVNYPTWVMMRYSYNLRYRWVHEVMGFWDCYHDDDQVGENVTSLTKFYFDVMPATIDDFAMWGGISMLDSDGDELKDSEETVTNEWKYDSDGDGVRDKTELDLGLDPTNFDTDGDGLDDEWELVYGTNATDSDTDDDLLPDYLEVAGWNIEFNYSQTEGGVLVPFTTRVYSNPRNNDSDGDGIDDYIEYQSGLNPRAEDTNGDSIPDEPAPETETVVEELWNIPVGSTMGFDIDSTSNIHVGSFSQEILKFNPSGVQIPGYGLGDLRYPMSIATDSLDGAYVQDWDIPDEDPQIWVDTYSNSIYPAIAMSEDGNTLAVGSRYDERVWIYTRGDSGWVLAQIIDTPFGSDNFGCSVAFTHGDTTLAIGAQYANWLQDKSSGSVHIYTKIGDIWAWTGYLPAPADYIHSFGADVAFSDYGNLLVIAEGYRNRFFVYLWDGNSYVFYQYYALPSTPQTMYVRSVDADWIGERLVIGAVDWDTGDSKAFVYEYDGTYWRPFELTIPGKVTGDEFGSDVSINRAGNTAMVGAPHFSEFSRGPGAVYVFQKDDSGNRWADSQVEMTRLSDPNGATNYRFGLSLQLTPAGDLALIGSPGRGRGGMFVFQKIGTNWFPLSWVDPYLETDHILFGYSVAMDAVGNRLMGAGRQNDIFQPMPVFEFSTAPDRIVHFDSDGILDDVFLPQLAWGFPNFLHAVQGMTADSEDNLYVSYADMGITGVRKYSPSAELLDVIGGDWLSHACGVSIDADGNIYVADKEIDDVLKFSPTGDLLPSPWSGFLEPEGVDVDSDGNIYVADTGNDQVLIFDENGIKIANFSFNDPRYIQVDSDGFVYVASYTRLAKYRIYEMIVEIEPPDFVLDWDEDGLSDELEITGWDITYVDSSGVQTLHVDSDPALVDTDLDTISDFNEWLLGSNPRSIDTDGDGLDDSFELANGFNITNNDSDGELLDDGTELIFGSDPWLVDTDFDGTDDYWEWIHGTNPTNEDSDGDGATDTEELDAGTDPLSPDSDGDFSFDGTELDEGTNPHDGDTDDDFIDDGLEHFYGTDPLSNDTDGDNVTDFVEIILQLDPLNNDTDGDNVTDSVELIQGTDPRDNDTDNDGIPDGLDPDTPSMTKGEIILVCDNLDDSGFSVFADTLAQYHNASIADLADFLANYTNEPWIILIGDPLDPPDTVGNLIYTLLEDAPDVLATMTEEGGNHIAVRYGVWNETQTVVMLAQATSNDVYPVLQALKEKNVTMGDDAVLVEFPLLTDTEHVVNIFLSLDDPDIVKTTDSEVMISLSEPAQPSILLSLFNQSTTPFALTNETGLDDFSEPMGKYLEIDMTIGGSEADPIESCMIRIYYTAADLDLTGNGMINDSEDLNETTLVMYYYDEVAGEWIPLHDGLDWVIGTGVNTTDLYLFGETYAGYVWAQVTHLSLYSIAGMTHNRPPDISGAYPSIEFLWPPNRKFHEVTIEGIVDPDGDAINITILSITSDEFVGWCPDAYGVGTNSTWLRAERSGCGNGRVYEITFLASDGRGGETIGSVFVYVPHHRKKGEYVMPVDDGQVYDATEPWRPKCWRWKWNWHWRQRYWHGFRMYLKHMHR
jgi:hypothetical protein